LVRPTRVDHLIFVLQLTAPWRFDSSPYSKKKPITDLN